MSLGPAGPRYGNPIFVIKTNTFQNFRFWYPPRGSWVPMGPGSPEAQLLGQWVPWPMGPQRPRSMAPWVPRGPPWDPMGSPLGSHGLPWVPMGSHGIPWVPMGSPRFPGAPHGLIYRFYTLIYRFLWFLVTFCKKT